MPLTILLTDAGRTNLAQLLTAGGATLGFAGWGSSTAAPLRSDTSLGSEIPPRVATTLTATTTSSANDTLRIVATLTAAASISVAEVGVFTASTGGALVLHGALTARALQAGDVIVFTITLQFP